MQVVAKSLGNSLSSRVQPEDKDCSLLITSDAMML